MKIFGLVVFLFLSLSCASENHGEENGKTDFALAAVEDNILTTDYTALVEITNVDIEDSAEGDIVKDEGDLVAIKYTARIFESYVGNDQKTIVFTEYIEKSGGFESVGQGALIVSLCKDKQGEYYLPDIGYELPAHDVIVEKAKEIKARIQSQKLSLRRKGDDSYVCVY